MTRLLFLAAALFTIVQSYNVAIFAPAMANSQILWNKRVGEELMNAGHNVTIFMLQLMEKELPKVDIHPKVHVVYVNASFGMDGEEMMKMQSVMAFQNLPLWDSRMRASMARFGEMYKSCEVMITNTSFHNLIIDSKFDIAFSHMYNYCSIGMIHITKIPTWIWLNSGALLDNVASSMGVPLPPSYCAPMMMDSGDKLSFIERVKSFIGHMIFKVTFKRIVADRETEVFRKYFGDDFPDLVDVASKAPIVMVNSNELYDLPRPTLHKIVNIGGVGIKHKDAKNLTGEFAKRTEKAKDGVIVFSFGSIAPVYLMPEAWKVAYFSAFAEFPNVQFFMRYEHPDQIADILPSNVYAAKWLPQMDLLQHKKTIALISHGGYNSVQDVIHAGKPILTTGLFGDQLRNAHLVERLGIGINMKKDDVSKENLVKNIRRLLQDKSLQENAVKMRDMVATKPISAETLLVRWTEFLAQHKTLDNLVPAGVNLNIFVYHSVDVILFLFFALFLVLFLVYKIVKCTCSAACRKLGFCKSPQETKKEQEKKKQ